MQNVATLQHLAFVLYRRHKTKFIAAQTYRNQQSMLRSLQWSVATAIKENVTAYFLYQDSGDDLENVFNILRMICGPGVNLDAYSAETKIAIVGQTWLKAAGYDDTDVDWAVIATDENVDFLRPMGDWVGVRECDDEELPQGDEEVDAAAAEEQHEVEDALATAVAAPAILEKDVRRIKVPVGDGKFKDLSFSAALKFGLEAAAPPRNRRGSLASAATPNRTREVAGPTDDTEATTYHAHEDHFLLLVLTPAGATWAIVYPESFSYASSKSSAAATSIGTRQDSKKDEKIVCGVAGCNQVFTRGKMLQHAGYHIMVKDDIGHEMPCGLCAARPQAQHVVDDEACPGCPAWLEKKKRTLKPYVKCKVVQLDPLECQWLKSFATSSLQGGQARKRALRGQGPAGRRQRAKSRLGEALAPALAPPGARPAPAPAPAPASTAPAPAPARRPPRPTAPLRLRAWTGARAASAGAGSSNAPRVKSRSAGLVRRPPARTFGARAARAAAMADEAPAEAPAAAEEPVVDEATRERLQALDALRGKIREHKEIEAKLKEARLNAKGLIKEFNDTEAR
ncbi:hypothetical protein JL720_11664 [Aureococcus anophagefferens]|nr:hypothetical protein JL720_11664 [Aureococcus anophagefferens]